MVRMYRTWIRIFGVLSLVAIFTLLLLNSFANLKRVEVQKKEYFLAEANLNGAWRNLSEDQASKLSKLGEILFLDRETPNVVDDAERRYTILIWKYGPSLERRHLRRFSNKRYDPFEGCSVNNCRLTYNDTDISTADLVVFHLHRTKSVVELPKGPRKHQQIWTFLTDESPYNTFLHSRNNTLKNYNGLFNWSMSYRMDTDIPVPYGRTVALKPGTKVSTTVEDFENWNKNKKQDVLVAIMGSNCGGSNNRWGYVKELRNHISVDVYGHCGSLKCPGHYTQECEALSRYKFYLAFENSNCDEYITEKLWLNAYARDAIPIVMGGSRLAYRQLLPPNSYINVEDFALPSDLADYIIYLNQTQTEMKTYFNWKRNFQILNEHGYSQTRSVHYCRICEALNYNSKTTKVYSDLESFWNKNGCRPAWNA